MWDVETGSDATPGPAPGRPRTATVAVVVLLTVVVGLVIAWIIALSRVGTVGDLPDVAVSLGGEQPRSGLPEPTGPSGAEALAAGPVAGGSPEAAPGAPVPDPAWVERVSRAAAVPERALTAYASADLVMQAEQPQCALSWATLAGIGWVESHHGTVRGNALGDDGRPLVGPIVGVPLNGEGSVAAIEDTDGGALDGDAEWDRALGPLQFIPSTWRRWSADADGDGVSDPQDVDDAALASARYLCASGAPLTDPAQWRQAVLAYNASEQYAIDVVTAANYYATRSVTT